MRLISQLSEGEFAQQDISQIPAADEVFRTPWGHMIQIMTILRLACVFVSRRTAGVCAAR